MSINSNTTNTELRDRFMFYVRQKAVQGVEVNTTDASGVDEVAKGFNIKFPDGSAKVIVILDG